MIKDLVSIIMPVGNIKLNILKQSFLSLKNQNYEKIQLIIVCDTLNAQITNYLKSYIKKNSNNTILHFNKENLGVTKSLNIALKFAEGEFIARFDSDDLISKRRIQLQKEYLSKNSNIDIVFSNYKVFFFNKSFTLKKNISKNDKIINWRMFFSNQFCHPSVMFRKTLVKKNQYIYENKYLVAQDYSLWTNLILAGVKFHILDSYLYYLRLHKNSISSKKKELQNNNSIDIGYSYLNNYLSSNFSKVDYSDLIYVLNSHTYNKQRRKLEIMNNIENILLLYNKIIKKLSLNMSDYAIKKYYIDDMNRLISFIGIRKSYQLSIISNFDLFIYIKFVVFRIIKKLLIN